MLNTISSRVVFILILTSVLLFSQKKIYKNFSNHFNSQNTTSQDWNWQFIGTPFGDTTVSGILIDPEDENIWYVSSIENGLYITRDGGNSWEHALTGKGLDCEGYQVDPNNSNKLIATVRDFVWVSMDKGLTWKHTYTCPEYIRSIHISKKNGNVYLGPQTDQNNNPGIYKSTDGGKTFNLLPFGVSTNYIICWDIEEDTNNNALYVSIELADHPQPYKPPLFLSFDNGATWSDISNGLGWHSLKLQIDTVSGTIYHQKEGGSLHKSTNFGNDWQFLNSEHLMRLFLDKKYPNRLFGGRPYSIEQGGAFFSSNSGKSFTNIGLLGKDVFSMLVNNNSIKVYAVCYGKGIYVADIPSNPTSNLLVTNTNDSGIGSLRNAIEESNSRFGTDTIQFRIPKTDPNFDASKGVWIIKPDSSLPSILDDDLIIDGTSQSNYLNEDTNPLGPEIVINGSNAKEYAYCIMAQAKGTEIYELTISNFTAAGISFFSPSSGIVSGCYVGTNFTGMTTAGNENGLQIFGCDSDSIIIGPSEYLDKPNIISGNTQYGIYIRSTSNSNLISGNYIGVNKYGTDTLRNVYAGIYLFEGTGENKVIENYIGGSSTGIEVNKFNNVYISNNFIGSDKKLERDLRNNIGIYIWNNSSNNKIVSNTIGYSINEGIHIENNNSVQNIISRNSISRNGSLGINNFTGGNTELTPPTITSVTNNEIKGTAGANQIIEIFADSSDEGQVYIDSTISDANGNFTLVASSLPAFPNITATARDANGNTSEFCSPFVFVNNNDNAITVTNTNDTGEGSLRNAIETANSNVGADTIKFNIPKSDPNFDANKGVWIIKPNNSLPGIIDSNLVIDGTSQRLFIGNDTNSEGPEIVIDGSNAGDCDGFNIAASGIEILELTINNYQGRGIIVSSIKAGRISGCYIGVSYNGLYSKANGGTAIYLNWSQQFQICPLDTIPNILSGNKSHGVYMVGGRHNKIISNIIGLNREASDTLGNAYDGIYVTDSDSNEIVDNIIGGNNSSNGINILRGNNNTISRNFIGCNNKTPKTDLGNAGCGISISVSSSGNIISENTIAFNKVYGVSINEEHSINNLLTRNNIFHNGWAGIKNENGANAALTPPTITSVTNNEIKGTAGANQIIEIFADSSNQGQVYIDSTISDASGNFTLVVSSLPALPNITATARDASGNTSAFSNPFIVTDVEEEQTDLPTRYSLSQNYPNPFNPTTTIKYSIPMLETLHATSPQEHTTSQLVQLKVYNILGKEVATLVNKQQPPGNYEVTFNANSAGGGLPSGVYFYKISVGKFNRVRKMLLIK